MATYDQEYWQVIEPMAKAQAAQPMPPPKNCLEIRARSRKFMEAVLQRMPFPENVTETRIDVVTPDGHTVPVYRYATAEQLARKDQPVVLYMHGGGMVSASAQLYRTLMATQVIDFGVQHFAVDYRLAPEATAPVMLEECYSVLAYLSGHAAALGIDAARIGVAGDSAGGGLATGVTLMARDRSLQPPVAKLIVLYPMLDDRTVQRHPPKGARLSGASTTDDDWAKRSVLVWSTEQNAMAWAAYLGLGNPGTDGALEAATALTEATANDAGTLPSTITPYSVPARAESLVGMPSTYIDVGALDLFLEEAVHFAAKLARDSVEFDFHVLHGLPHAYNQVAPSITAAQSARALQKGAYTSF
ncbi:arylesterase monooxygenase [Grosmannia clavigera kw1407]|uniref:Arylesterase monooxygenase n=1 Tax=Grosmannia clavigera (strain kw1407 / UAMH 11150) TaxID=655863 RepID=F0XEJ6_GROCL|nr:arylesterase monooxygenase [Grosmannia clavigera kw1407]EFX04410.1 arylesterase monooxygenase [Grosmannia clavigera kw1407]